MIFAPLYQKFTRLNLSQHILDTNESSNCILIFFFLLIILALGAGRYIFAEMSQGQPLDSGTVIFTPPLGAKYLRFHYHMSGRQVRILCLTIITFEQSKRTIMS